MDAFATSYLFLIKSPLIFYRIFGDLMFLAKCLNKVLSIFTPVGFFLSTSDFRTKLLYSSRLTSGNCKASFGIRLQY